MAASGMMQLLKTFGVDINLEEIKEQALQFKAVADSINNRLGLILQQNAAIMAALKIGGDNGEHAVKQLGSETASGEQARPDASAADRSAGNNAEQV